jgi:hypothetical protein
MPYPVFLRRQFWGYRFRQNPDLLWIVRSGWVKYPPYFLPTTLSWRKEAVMNLTYAVDRLFDSGWTPFGVEETEPLPDGRRIPSVLAVQQEFARAGLELSIKHNLVFGCYRAAWAPIGEPLDPARSADERHGAVVGACEREAAVYALAQLRSAQIGRQRQVAVTA